MPRPNRQGNVLLLLLLICAAAGIGIAMAWLKYRATFDGVEENFMVYQSRSVVGVYLDDGIANDKMEAKALTEFPLAEVINGKTYDFGVAEPGKLLQHSFKIKNSGNLPLEIMLEGVTCKCLTMGLEKNKVTIVEPGDVFDIKLEWRSDSLTKNFQQFARIKTNDPDMQRSQIELKVSGRIVSPVLASPERVSCHLRTSAESKEFEFMVHGFESESIDPETFDLKNVTFSNTLITDYLEYRWDKLSEEEIAKEDGAVTGYKVTGTVKPGAPRGTYIGKLSVETTSGHPVGLDFAVKVEAPIEIRPINRKGNSNYYPESQIIDFGIVSPGEVTELSMMILYNIKDPDLKIFLDEPVVQPDGYIQAEIIKDQKTGIGRMIQLKVSIAEDCPKAQFTGPKEDNMLKLRVKSNSEFAEELVFFVSFAKN